MQPVSLVLTATDAAYRHTRTVSLVSHSCNNVALHLNTDNWPLRDCLHICLLLISHAQSHIYMRLVAFCMRILLVYFLLFIHSVDFLISHSWSFAAMHEVIVSLCRAFADTGLTLNE